ncbi:MAG: hypothetical protein UR85_C0004G0091 [Candidatus Nomurabacteria bacterium GW2011_GWF2_35_66]|uniref:Uncharacterized protein n=1 Tax=Candidatus Nomurabacteria bacterium GW2011_GWE1_35_16 TaxID=1618761 RepID=A0A0G0BT00_9BACT|nr:MAG: hypothetical protein UR55_C0002G0090 [Candidatus Nomurabacteria bacterium GW2011_GWF1_34_20]KKP63669.1 MAG: hypothetical protein UR57_C0002G0090 [Candidatus Nomurabacteria bacterium GW2011_GWE2_34_25]KKP66871.1 MAG: hypothetical protein UR64_C0002G0087 [Candidatus Nomurabacteria bacterium GW2011_GWE1_35_16]KKP83497.1 MAG: hypothetical protein UR85_C0004G0091 [Candidatus Nomurabacteria bacterium GW2011_GWF2_35_66]HAE36571.1 hypothetical protein [Candidatus Nomurabacteria bacterium]
MKKIIILVLFSQENNFFQKSKKEIENLLFSKIKKDGAIDLIVRSSFIGSAEINPEILKDINGVLYTSDVQREDVEKSTSILKEKIDEKIMFARVSANMGFGLIDYNIKGVATLINVGIYPYMIRYSYVNVESFFD